MGAMAKEAKVLKQGTQMEPQRRKCPPENPSKEVWPLEERRERPQELQDGGALEAEGQEVSEG